jgi:antitoxin component YwqK of YwqJK toxin-antitoxin module
MLRLLVATCALLALPAVASSGNLVYLNGTKFDDRYSMPEHFTGEYSLRDMDTGKVTHVEHRVDGVAEGEYVDSTPTGVIQERGAMRHGKRHGLIQRFDRNGKLQRENAYVDGKLQGLQKDYDEGHLSRVYSVDADGLRDADFGFNAKGQLTQLTCGKRPVSGDDAAWCGLGGKRSTVSLYDETGRLRATEQYLWGQADGTFKRFHLKTGQVLSEARYEKGKEVKDGERHFSADGALSSKTDCDEARSSCTETIFFEDQKPQKPKLVTVYRGGKLERRTTYFQNGKVSQEVARQKDRFVISTSDDEGHVLRKGTYVEASGWSWAEWMPDGVVESFDGDGKLRVKETYKKGVLDGTRELYWTRDGHALKEVSEFAKGKVRHSQVYVDGKLAARLEYAPDGSLSSRQLFEHPRGSSSCSGGVGALGGSGLEGPRSSLMLACVTVGRSWGEDKT